MDQRLPRRRAALGLSVLVAVLAACGSTDPSGPSADAGTSPAAPTSSAPAATPRPSDPAAALRISAPWVLDDEFPEVRQQILDGVLDDEGFRAAVVRHVTGPDGESAFLLAADAGLAAETDLESYARRLSTSTMTGGAVETIGDDEVIRLQTDDVSIVAWLEPPLLLAVYAADAETAGRIAAAVLDAP